MDLFYNVFGNSGKPLIILHGLFGMSDNWQVIAGKLSDNFKVITVDLRNHGRSPHSNLMNFEVMAEDVFELTQKLNLGSVGLIGHSMGGKVAMTFAGKYPERTDRLLVADIAPGRYPPGHQRYFDALQSLNLNTDSRKMIEDQLNQKIHNRSELLFLLKNLQRNPAGGFSFKMNLDVIQHNYLNLIDEVSFPLPLNVDTLFLKGEHSAYIKEKDLAHIANMFNHYKLAVVPGAGHWIHADNSVDFLKITSNFLESRPITG